MDTESPRLRLSIVGIVVMSLFSVLFARLYYLQVLSPESGEIRSVANRVRTVEEEAPRGRILDAKGRVLVDNRTSLVVTIDRNVIEKIKNPERADLLLRLARQLTSAGIPTKVSDIERRIADPQYNPLQPVPIASDVPEDLMVYFAERTDDYPGVEVKRSTVRVYPNGSLAAHVLGYVGRISEEEYAGRMGTPEEPKTPVKPYQPDSSIGKAGVEATLEDELRGTPGERQVEVDARGRVISVVNEKKPIPGNDVQLTVDIDVQKDAEQKLAEQLAARKGQKGNGSNKALFEGKAGSTIVEDPRSGNIIAMASYPTYDPSVFVNGISQDLYDRLKGNGNRDDNALINRAISEQYSPGSTFKLITAYAALSSGLLGRDEKYNDTGSYQLSKNSQPKTNAEGARHGVINVTQAITVSSDVFFYWIGNEKFGSGKNMNLGIQDAARQFGLGQPTGIQLPNEAKGNIPDPTWKRATYDALGNDSSDGDWYGGDSANLAVGQGDMQLTPLQLTNAYAAFAMHGDLHQPNLVLRVLSTGANATDPNLAACPADADLATAKCVVRTPQPIVKNHIDMPANVYDPIHEGLDGVTKSKDATASALFDGFNQNDFPVLGKTGTIENDQGRADNSTFVGVGPETDPQYVINSYLEHMGFGAEGAGPVVRQLFDLVSGQRADPCAAPDPNAPSATATTTPANCPPAPPATVAPASTGGGSNGGGSTTIVPPETASTVPRQTTTTTRAGKAGATTTGAR